MSLSMHVNRTASLWVALALVGATSIAGCNRSVSLPPLVEGPDAPQIPGKFVWHNLVTDDSAAARQFYGELFGWEFDVKEDGRYSVITYGGHNLGGILDTSKEGKTPKGAHWLSAMSVPNVDASLDAVRKAGGKQLEAPVDVNGVGRVVTVEGADGAVFHLLSSAKGDPPDVEPAVHTWLWHELLANHADRAIDFYQTAFGYRIEVLEKKPGSEYRVLWSSGEARAGVAQNPFKKTRSAWIPYVRVDDPSALAARVTELGGRVILAPRPELRDGTLAVVLDPGGAPLALQKWSPDMEVNP